MLLIEDRGPDNGDTEQATGGTMRLTCPNCGAQYEVPEAVIPASGRDVQCSNCGDTWFQHHPDHAPAEAEDVPDEYAAPPDAAAEADPEPAPEPIPEPVPEPTAEAAPEEPPAQRRLDPNVADILREEAERERAARAAEGAGGLETQPDLGLADPGISEDERSRQARARMERLRGGGETPPPAPSEEQVDESRDDDIDPSSRRNLLPDIEEINSSLTSSGERGDTASAAAAELPEEVPISSRRGGFRSGFRLAVITFVVATIVYLTASSIAQMIPAAEAPLAQYVEAVNAARTQLNDLVSRVIAQIGGPAN
ncbi:MAG: zinc-ribbon domain-containing protein [Roseovarius sp.]|uniref:zinc-ribbon domain-containing protein n=2 Tax=Roseovarius sp. TaxID=1486281 RepID=UPI0032ED7BEE